MALRAHRLALPSLAAASLAIAGCGAGRAETPATAPSSSAHGLAVLARGGVRDAAWPLAQDVYRSARLRPRLDEPRARVLAGEEPRDASLNDLAETREAVVDDGPASRRLLASLAVEHGLEGVLVVTRAPDGQAVARLFVRAEGPAGGRFEAIEVRSQQGGAAWPGAATALERLLPQAAPGEAPRPAAPRPTQSEGTPFYRSPWFWGAAGAAVLAGGAFFLATRDSSPDSIHLQMQVPR